MGTISAQFDDVNPEDMMNTFGMLLQSGMFNEEGSNLNAPKVIWPKSFTMKLSTDIKMIYNITIDLKVDAVKNRIWSQLNYTSPFFGTDEAFQLAIHSGNKNVSLKIADECKWAKVNDVSYLYLSFLFNYWNYLTKYVGKTADGYHEFRFINLIQFLKVANITFLFKDEGKSSVQLAKIGVTSKSLGSYFVDVSEPVTEKSFSDSDFEFGSLQ